ncbi:MAG: hypothetical protein OHK0024_00010 [Thalassobaculales bacterium]
MAEQPVPLDPVRLGPPPGSRLAVVGGCGGIGRAVVRAAVASGLRVAVMDLPFSLAQYPPPDGVERFPVDATDEAAVTAAFGRLEQDWDGLDGLVNLAGFALERRPVDAVTGADWDEVVEGNLRSTYLVAKAALPLLRQAGGGAIVHAASGLASRVMPGFGPYAAAKAGVIALTRAIAVENAPDIRANVVAPGAIDTEFQTGGTGRAAMRGLLDRDSYLRGIPMGRIGQPDDVVGPVLFLLGDASRYMTGQVLWINGGGLTP